MICNGLNLWWLPRVVLAPERTRHGAMARMLRETTAVVLIYSVILVICFTVFVDFVIADATRRPIVVSVGLLIGVARWSAIVSRRHQLSLLAGTNWQSRIPEHLG